MQRLSIALTLLLCVGCGADDGGSGSGSAGSGGGATSSTGPGAGAGGVAPMIEPLALPAEMHSHGEPSLAEQELLELVQRARLDPVHEGPLLLELEEAQNAIEQFGVNRQQTIAEFAGYAPAPPLAFHPQLNASALFHNNDMATAGFQGHEGSAGDTLGERVEAAGYDYASIAENVFAYARGVVHAHAALTIDWGVPGLGHRINILDLERRRRHIGISIIDMPPHMDVGPFVVTQNFGRHDDDSLRYLVGVAFRDVDGDSSYDAGEGESLMNVVPETGGVYATTSISGGYAIPFAPLSGTVRVQLQTADGEVLVEETVLIGEENVKLDFLL